MNETCTCGCCEGTEKITPQRIANRPGLKALAYRAGTHATFLETMLARLSEFFLEIPASDFEAKKSLYPLQALKTREADDAAIALMDCWATVAEVLTFYQERIANEGFLGTALERRSILELGHLVGYKLRPGVAASVYLAFEIERDQTTVIPPGVRGQSIPGPGEMPQAFETSEPLEARFVWNELKPRLTRPQFIKWDNTKHQITSWDGQRKTTFFFKGIATNLKSNVPLLFIFTDIKIVHYVDTIEESAEQNRTKITRQLLLNDFKLTVQETVDFFLDAQNFKIDSRQVDAQNVISTLTVLKSFSKGIASFASLAKLVNDKLIELEKVFKSLPPLSFQLKDWVGNIITTLNEVLLRIPASGATGVTLTGNPAFEKLRALVDPLLRPPSLQPVNPLRRPISVGRAFSDKSDLGPQLLLNQRTELQKTLYEAWRNAAFSQANELKSIVVFRVKAAPFGHNAPPMIMCKKDPAAPKDECVCIPKGNVTDASDDWNLISDGNNLLPLDTAYEQIKPGSWVVIKRPCVPLKNGETPKDYNCDKGRENSGDFATIVRRVVEVQTISKAAYNISAKLTQLRLDQDWLTADDKKLTVCRGTTIYAQSEDLELTEDPIESTIEGGGVELDGLYDGFKSGRWLLIAGERIDLTQNNQSDKVRASELVMLTAATQELNESLPGDTPHTKLHFANNLAYKYKRDTVTINANVAHATHGETKTQVLGSGDGSMSFQEFRLNNAPLTYISATTPSGIESTLTVRVNDLRWRESDNLSDLAPAARSYITRQDNEGNTFVIFGNGERGARLPTGVENIKAVYRSGIGKAGNVAAEQITLLATRPLGVKGVRNPQAATGGADPEDANSGRRNATVALKALDRAVSVEDYADFANAFAGIGKASAVRFSDGTRELVHLTIAGDGDIPISKNSDLYRNLQKALFNFGDPRQPLQIDIRELLFIVASARVRLFPDFLWEKVEPRIRAALLEAFGFDNRELGQPVLRSELISFIEAIDGVDYVDIDKFDALSQDDIVQNLDNLNTKIGRLPNGDKIEDRVIINLASIDLSNTSGPIIKPAQIAYLSPAVPDTLILTEITE